MFSLIFGVSISLSFASFFDIFMCKKAKRGFRKEVF